jgi:hypothetical protein
VQAVFVPDGGDSTLCKVTFKSDSKTVVMYAVKGAAATIPEESFAREGYTVEFTPNPTNITGDTVCTAVYTGIGYKIKYMPNGGSGKAYTQSMVYGTNAKLMDCDFTKSGYEFAGWATKSGATEADYTAGQSVGNLTSTEGKTVYLYAVWKKSVAKCTFSGISSSYVYSGSAVRPTVTVKDGSKTLTKGTDYTVTYSGGTSCGTAKITVTGKGSYTGKRTLSFAVVPDKTTVGRVSRSGTAIRLVWTAVKGADSYEIQKLVNGAYVTVGTTTDTQYRDSGMKNGTQAQYRIRATGGGQYGAFTYITTCTKTRTPSLKAAAKVGKVKLSWNRISEADGYQVLMSTSKNGKYTAIRYPNPASVTSCTRTGLTSGKTYYFKIRSYKTVNGKKLWSNCSAAVKVTVK